MHGRSQAVRIPKAFRLPGDRVRVRWMGRGILLEPMEFDVDAWFAELDKYKDIELESPPDPPLEPEEPLFPDLPPRHRHSHRAHEAAPDRGP